MTVAGVAVAVGWALQAANREKQPSKKPARIRVLFSDGILHSPYSTIGVECRPQDRSPSFRDNYPLVLEASLILLSYYTHEGIIVNDCVIIHNIGLFRSYLSG
jgi:hypothetical protein